MTALLLQPLTIRGMTMPNRVALSPMTMTSGADGMTKDWHYQHYGSFAASGVGFITIESTAIAPDGRIGAACLGLYSDETEDSMRRLVRYIKSLGPAKVGIQLFYSGRKGSLPVRWAPREQLPIEQGGWETVAPSPIPFRAGWRPPREATPEDITRLRSAWIDAARRAVAAGFDAVELHSAHGYGLHPWLSTVTNRRADQYGGSVENRMRFPLEVIRGIRKVIPHSMPLGMRISAVDGVDGGIVLEESIAYVLAAKGEGIDYVCVSTGGAVADFRLPPAPGFQVPYAEEIRRATGVITRAVGLIYDPHQAEAILQSGKADFVALGRTLLDDPRWVFHAAEALGEAPPYPRQYGQLRPERWPREFVRTPETERMLRTGVIAVSPELLQRASAAS